MDTKTKVVLITGVTSGIGKSIALYLASVGIKVLLVARNTEQVSALRKEISESYSYVCDLSCLDQIKGIFDYIKNNNLILSGFIHCAGITANMPLKANTVGDMEAILKINTEVFVEICKYASSKRVSVDGASFIAISSTASFVGSKGLSVYAASKAAINSLVKSFAIELLPRKIRVNAIAPAMVNTRMYEQTKEEIPEIEEAVSRNQPLGVIEPQSIAYLAEFLLSDKSKYITGAIIPVGAGNVLW